MYTPILVRRTLDRKNILEVPNNDALPLYTGLKNFPGIFPGISVPLERIPRETEIPDTTKLAK